LPRLATPSNLVPDSRALLSRHQRKSLGTTQLRDLWHELEHGHSLPDRHADGARTLVVDGRAITHASRHAAKCIEC